MTIEFMSMEAAVKEITLLRAEINAQQVSKETYVAEWMERLQDRNQLIAAYREEAVIARATIKSLQETLHNMHTQAC